MYLYRDLDDPRRRTLLKLLASGAFSTYPAAYALADIFGDKPARLPAGQSIFRLRGDVKVNGETATMRTQIGGHAVVETGPRSEIVFASGDNAYVLRANGRMELAPPQPERSIIKSALRLLTGKVLAVFSPGKPVSLTSTTATIGIRGTGVYMEADPEQTYFCTCYGVTDIGALNDKASTKTVAAEHHDEPVYILANAKEGKSIRRAPFINHTDQELMLIETLVGREPPFVFPSEDYGGPRRDY